MLTIRLETYDGASYELPTLLQWDIQLTGSVPCDSLWASCLYDPGMAEVLPRATRFTALRQGTVVLLAEVEGRGMAALLLDNESEAFSYERALLSEILANHVSPYGISTEARQEISGDGYAVPSGSSQWKALQGFTRRYGGFDPYFTGEGVLVAAPLWGSGRELKVDDRTPLLGLRKREQRYGVISEVLIQDKVPATRWSTNPLPPQADSAGTCSTCPKAPPAPDGTPASTRSPSLPWSSWRLPWSSPSPSPPPPGTASPWSWSG